MKVTVDTRHDSLEEALATVHAAFGSSTTQPTSAGVATKPATAPAATTQVTKRAIAHEGGRQPRNQEVTGKEVTGEEASCYDRRDEDCCQQHVCIVKEPRKKAPATKASSARNGTKATRSMTPTSNIAPPGQADAIRAWAKAEGMTVKQAGRLPAAVIQAYQDRPDH